MAGHCKYCDIQTNNVCMNCLLEFICSERCYHLLQHRGCKTPEEQIHYLFATPSPIDFNEMMLNFIDVYSKNYLVLCELSTRLFDEDRFEFAIMCKRMADAIAK